MAAGRLRWILLLVVLGAVYLGWRELGADSAPPSSPGALQEVEVTRHVDGDTLHVSPVEAGPAGAVGADVTVRLLEIDTPETVKPGAPVECYGPEAAAALARLLPVGARAWAEADDDLTDSYDRTLLYLYLDPDGEHMVNLALVREGYAEAVLFQPNDAHIATMRSAEREARAAGRGLWGAC